MPRYVAFLRGVSPMNAKMPELKRTFEKAGFENVKTVLSSGNVVFDSTSKSETALARQIEKAMQEHLDRTFMTIVRSTKALQRADRLRSLQRISSAAEVEARGDFSSQGADGEAVATDQIFRRAHPGGARPGGTHVVCAAPGIAGVHAAHRKNVRHGDHHANAGHRQEVRGGLIPVTLFDGGASLQGASGTTKGLSHPHRQRRRLRRSRRDSSPVPPTQSRWRDRAEDRDRRSPRAATAPHRRQARRLRSPHRSLARSRTRCSGAVMPPPSISGG